MVAWVGVVSRIRVWFSGQFPASQSQIIHHISIGNVKPDSQVLWAPILIAYLSSIHVLYLLKQEFMKFLELRIAFQALGDPDVNPQKVSKI